MKGAGIMTRWEYDYGKLTIDELDKFGSDGWEVVHVTAAMHGGSDLFYTLLKRQLKEETESKDNPENTVEIPDGIVSCGKYFIDGQGWEKIPEERKPLAKDETIIFANCLKQIAKKDFDEIDREYFEKLKTRFIWSNLLNAESETGKSMDKDPQPEKKNDIPEDWLPMSSAPRDGSEILICCDERTQASIHSASYDQYERRFRCLNFGMIDGDYIIGWKPKTIPLPKRP